MITLVDGISNYDYSWFKRSELLESSESSWERRCYVKVIFLGFFSDFFFPLSSFCIASKIVNFFCLWRYCINIVENSTKYFHKYLVLLPVHFYECIYNIIESYHFEGRGGGVVVVLFLNLFWSILRCSLPIFKVELWVSLSFLQQNDWWLSCW